MELIEGYQETKEWGIIPLTWRLRDLKSISVKIQDGTHFSPPIIRNGEFLYITSKNVKFGYLDISQVEKISANAHSEIYRRCDVQKGDILLTKDGANTGNAAINIISEEFSLLSSVAFIRLNKNEANTEYLLQQILSGRGQSIIAEEMSGNAITRLTLLKINNLTYPLPPLPEQTAIATVLSDTDQLIQAIEKKIAKKRLIKQGAMQELLRPKEGWAERKLGEIGRPFGGLSGKSKKDFKDGLYPYIPFMNIMTNPKIDPNYLDYVNISKDESQNKCQKGDLFFNGSSETPEEVGMCSVLTNDIHNLYLNSFCFGFRMFDESIDGLFLTYFFRSEFGRKHMSLLAQGATRYNLSKANFLKLSITIPSTTDQQISIATILSDMDYEIESLENQLAKYKELKQGLMQNLLTGKIRLV